MRWKSTRFFYGLLHLPLFLPDNPICQLRILGCVPGDGRTVTEIKVRSNVRGAVVRGTFEGHRGLFSYIVPEERVPEGHPLRKIREGVRAVLTDMDRTVSQP